MTTERPRATERLYLHDDACIEADATVVALASDALAFDRSCFYPGGGGQPPDRGTVRIGADQILDVASARADADDVVWHVVASELPPEMVGQPARLVIDRAWRQALTRYHTVLHVLNTTVLRDYAGWITGAQIAADYARIDFKVDTFSPALCAEVEAKVNGVLAADHSIRAYAIPEAEFRQRPELLRTLVAQPPVSDGRVRIVEIQGFDAQACGGTHVHSTAAVGRFSIVRTENKGRNNKRLYVRLDDPDSPANVPG